MSGNPDKPIKQILVAGVGNAWMRDDAFGGECARRLESRGVPEGVLVTDFGTNGLDLAYELIKGYDALVLLDATRQGHPPGTLYVMEQDRSEFPTEIEDGQAIDPHDMHPQTVLHFVNATGAWPGKVLVIGCEPGDIDQPGYGMSDVVKDAVERAVDLVLETLTELQSDEAYA